MKTMTKKQRVKAILDLLDEHYGTEKICYLNHNSPWQLLVAVILSAQCTDARVNIVTGPLFERYPSVEALAGANQKELEGYIHSAGFYQTKARNIIACCRRLVDVFDGQVPELMKVLPKDHWILYNIQIITLGRQICTARNPKCAQCFLGPYCPSCEGDRTKASKSGEVRK